MSGKRRPHRDARGRFTRGGNVISDRLREARSRFLPDDMITSQHLHDARAFHYRQALYDRVTDGLFAKIVDRLVQKALYGEMPAIKEIFVRLMGKTIQYNDPKAVDVTYAILGDLLHLLAPEPRRPARHAPPRSNDDDPDDDEGDPDDPDDDDPNDDEDESDDDDDPESPQPTVQSEPRRPGSGRTPATLRSPARPHAPHPRGASPPTIAVTASTHQPLPAAPLQTPVSGLQPSLRRPPPTRSHTHHPTLAISRSAARNVRFRPSPFLPPPAVPEKPHFRANTRSHGLFFTAGANANAVFTPSRLTTPKTRSDIDNAVTRSSCRAARLRVRGSWWRSSAIPGCMPAAPPTITASASSPGARSPPTCSASDMNDSALTTRSIVPPVRRIARHLVRGDAPVPRCCTARVESPRPHYAALIFVEPASRIR